MHTIRCHQCGARGPRTPADHAAHARAQELKAEREQRGLTLQTVATRLGVRRQRAHQIEQHAGEAAAERYRRALDPTRKPTPKPKPEPRLPDPAKLLRGAQLQNERLRAGLSQRDLANQLGVVREKVSTWERTGATEPTAARYREALRELLQARGQRLAEYLERRMLYGSREPGDEPPRGLRHYHDRNDALLPARNPAPPTDAALRAAAKLRRALERRKHSK